MASWSLKKPELLEVSESSLRIIRNNLDNIGISIPLKEADEKKIFEWAIRQKEHCTEKECSLVGTGYTFEELNLLMSEFSPYDDKAISFARLNRRLEGKE
ncbi:MAG: hypothetical protein IIT75_02065 [Candidatus Methanomethylophilus sp.]|jgi:hypothetical protein|nr:hypothetical protein [Methanomethylophilus sp.]